MINKNLVKLTVPPLKTQGIKTKQVKTINQAIDWNGDTFIEAFLGSGVVTFNLQPKKALLCDTNPHIIYFYQSIQKHILTPENIRRFLEHEGRLLQDYGADYYYKVRDRFNLNPTSQDFLFLNRSCYNGLMRFNRKGHFNASFCKKNNRFSKGYITKIVNQVKNVQQIIDNNDYTFKCQSFETTLSEATKYDFVYLDPPYIERYANYFNSFTTKDAYILQYLVQQSSFSYGLSMWRENKYRCNYYIRQFEGQETIIPHFYHIGNTTDHRQNITESLIVNIKESGIKHE